MIAIAWACCSVSMGGDCANIASGNAKRTAIKRAFRLSLIWRRLRNISLLPSIDQKIGGGHDEYSEQYRGGKAADDGAGHGRVLFAALAEFQGHRDHSDNGCQRCHQNGPQTYPAGRDYSVLHRQALLFELVRKIDNQNAV